MMTEAQPDYLAYLLRLWRTEGVGQEAVWRASLEDPHTGERLNFAGLEALFDFLEEQTGGCARRAQPRAKPESPKTRGKS